MANVRPHPFPLILIGIASGILAGLFGIGGGTIIVPALALWLGMTQRLAAGTSVTAILPTALVGAISYGLQGNVAWIAAACLALGVIVGAEIGSMLLSRLSTSILQWVFIGFLAVVIVSLWFVVPQRDDELIVSALSGSLLVLTGLVTGVLSGLMGVGGGIVVVPILMFFFGSNDLTAKGTSLVMMVPGSVTATVGNLRRRNVDLRAAAFIGITASLFAPLGTIAAAWISPLTGNILFSLYLAFICIRMVVQRLRKPA